jgi:hypothetical protein
VRSDSSPNGPSRIFQPFGGSTDGSDDRLSDPRIAATAVVLLVLVPLLPFLAVVWTISRTLRGVRRRVSWE